MEQIRIDLIPGGVTPNAHASQYDIGRVIRFKLYNGESPYTLAGTETVTIDITKPDGVEETITLTNTSSDYVDFITENGLLNQAGLYECEFRITDGGDDIGTQNFNLRAEADAKGAVIIMEAQGNPAHFETDLAGALVSCIVDISYNANGYKSALVLNTSNTSTTNKTPYLFRPSFSNGYGYETLIGGTCGVNQLANIITGISEGATITLDANGVIEFSGVTTGNPIISHITHISGHKYLCLQKTIANPNNIDFTLGMDSGSPWIAEGDIVGDHNSIYTSVYDTYFKLFYANGQDLTGIKLRIQIIDLTAYFNPTIADYVYTLESGTSGAGITWLKNNGFFGADYYPYNSGALLSVKTSKKINRDSNNVIIGEYPLDDIELRGILKLDGNNNLYYDGDTYESNGSVTRKYGIVDLGTLDYSYFAFGNTYQFSTDILSYIKSYSGNVIANFICGKYITSMADSIYGGTSGDKVIASNSQIIRIVDSAYSDTTAFKNSLDGVYLVYELATPTTETADTFTNPMIVDGNGTEEFVDGRAVQMPVGHSTIYGEDMKARFTDFGVTVYGGEYNLTTGVLTGTKNADGTDKNPPETFQLTPVYIPVRNGDNYIADNTNGDVHVKYIKKA